MGDYLPPAEGTLASYTPPIYIVMVMTPAGPYTFNKMAALLIAHLVIFSPGARLPNWSQMKEGIVKNSIVFTGYQYNLKGDLLPVPREFYSDRYLPPPPLHREPGGRTAVHNPVPSLAGRRHDPAQGQIAAGRPAGFHRGQGLRRRRHRRASPFRTAILRRPDHAGRLRSDTP